MSAIHKLNESVFLRGPIMVHRVEGIVEVLDGPPWEAESNTIRRIDGTSRHRPIFVSAAQCVVGADGKREAVVHVEDANGKKLVERNEYRWKMFRRDVGDVG